MILGERVERAPIDGPYPDVRASGRVDDLTQRRVLAHTCRDQHLAHLAGADGLEHGSLPRDDLALIARR